FLFGEQVRIPGSVPVKPVRCYCLLQEPFKIRRTTGGRYYFGVSCWCRITFIRHVTERVRPWGRDPGSTEPALSDSLAPSEVEWVGKSLSISSCGTRLQFLGLYRHKP